MTGKSVNGNPGDKKALADFECPSAEATVCPYTFYKALRDEAPVYKYPGRNDYLVSRRDAMLQVLRNPDVFSNRVYLGDPALLAPWQKTWLEHPPHTPGTAIETSFSLPQSDPPEHPVKRRALSHLVNTRYIQSCEDTLRRIANELIDSFVHDGSAELRTQFADPLALLTICELAGFPPEDRDIFLSWERSGTGHGRRFLTEQERQTMDKDAPERSAYCEEIIKDRMVNPREDFITEVVQAQLERDGEINLPYLVSEIGLVLTAGNETTSRLVANTMKLLLENPDELDKLLADPSLVPSAIDHVLRFESPTQCASRYRSRAM